MSIFKSKVVSVVLTLAMVFSVLATPVANAATTTTDNTATTAVTTNDAAQFLSNAGLLQGDGNGNLMLDQNLTREQACVAMARLLGVESEAEVYPTDGLTFTDVTDEYYAPFVAWAQDNGLVKGYSETVFGFGNQLTAWQTKALFVRALGYKDVADDQILAKAGELGISNGSTANDNAAISRADMALLMYNTIHGKTASGTILGVDLGVIKADVATDYSITAKVAAEDSMEVTFDKAVADTSKVTFDVTGAMTITPTVTWNDAKTVATLKSAGIFLDGTYTIKASGLTFAKDKDTATVIVSKNGVAKIEILGDKLVRTGDNKGEVKFKLTDFYGNDVTEKMAYDITLNSSRAGNIAIKDAKKGIIEVTATTNWTNYPAVAELVQVTAYAKTAVNGTVATASSTLTVTELSRVDKVTLGNIVLPSGYTKLTMGKSNAGYVVISAVDQFGRDVTDLTALSRTDNNSEVFYSISNTNVLTSLTTETNSDSKDEIRMHIDLSGITNKNDARPVTLQLISKYKGTASNTLTLDIKQGKTPYRVTMGSLQQVVAVGDSFDDGVAVIPLNVYDEDGVQLTNDEIADHESDFQYTNPTGFNFAIATSGVNKGKLVATTVPTTKGMYTAMIQIDNATTSPASMTIDVKDKAEVRSVKVDATPATNLLYNSTAKMKYQFIDQYGRKMSDTMLNPVNLGEDSDHYSTWVRYSLSDLERASAKIVDVNGALVKDASNNDAIATTSGILINDLRKLTVKDSIQVTALQKTGTSSLKIEVLKVDTHNANAVKSIISTDSKTFTIADGVPSSLTFTVDTIPTIKAFDTTLHINGDSVAAGDGLYANGFDADGHGYAADDQANYYVKEVTVSAKDSNGNSFAVPYDRILSVSSSDTSVAVVKKDTVDQKIMIAGSTDWTLADSAASTKSATITMQIGTDTEAKSITGTVTVSKDAPKAQQVLFIDTPLTHSPYKELPTDYKEVKEVTLNDQADFYIVYKDQYGVYTQVGTTALSLVNSDKAQPGTVFTYTAGGPGASDLDLVNVNRVKENSTLVLMYSKDGAYGTINVRTGSIGQVAEDGTFDVAAPTATVAADLSDLLVTVTFNEAVSSDPVTAADLAAGRFAIAANNGHTVTKGAVTKVSSTVYTIAFTTADAVAGDTITVTLNGVYDVKGNAMTALTPSVVMVP